MSWFQAVEDVVFKTSCSRQKNALFLGVQPANRQTFASASQTTTEVVVRYLQSATNMIRYDFVKARLAISRNNDQIFHVCVLSELLYACVMLYTPDIV